MTISIQSTSRHGSFWLDDRSVKDRKEAAKWFRSNGFEKHPNNCWVRGSLTAFLRDQANG